MKRSVRLLVIVGAIAAMIVAIVLLQSRTTDEPAAPAFDWTADDPDRVTLLQTARDQIVRIEVETPEQTLVIERRDDGSFRPRFAHDVAFNTTQVNRVVGNATSVSSRRLIGEVDNTAEYGFDAPRARIRVVTADEEHSLIVGAMTPARDAFYVMRPDDPNVYSVFSSWINPFLTTTDALRVRTLPQIATDALERIRISTLGGRLIEAYRRGLAEEADVELGFASYLVTSPFARVYQANTNWLEELSQQVPQLRIGRFVDDAPTNLARYGLDPPRATIEVSDADNTLSLRIGDQTEGGRYAMREGLPSVFVLSGAEPIVSVRPYATISAFALILNIDLIDSFVVEAPGERFVGQIERTEIDGEDEPEERFLLNGTEIADRQFRRLYQWAIGLMVDAEGATRTVGEPTATITYNFVDDSPSRSVSFIQENQNFHAVVRDGQTEFLIASTKIERMLAAFRQAVAEF